jgi:hypothetical protein
MADVTTPVAPPQQSGDGAQEQVHEAAGQAKDKAQEAAGQARQQASDKVREQVDQRSTQAGEQVASTAGDLRSVGEQLRSQGKDTPARLAEQAAERSERLGSYLRDSDSDRILNDVEDFARRQPWAVVAGGLALGFAASRFLKASSSDRYKASQGSGNIASNGHSPTAISPPPPPAPPVPAAPMAPPTPGATLPPR